MISKIQTFNSLTLLYVTDTGLKHRVREENSQDAVLLYNDGSDFVLAVADGVGSCRHSAEGSSLAVKVSKEAFLKLKNGEIDSDALPYEIALHWAEAIPNRNIDDYCTTIKVAIKTGCKVILLSIGDGLLGITSESVSVLCPADDSLFANQTICLNSETIPSDFWINELTLDESSTFAIVACTDGVANGIREGQELSFINEIETNTSVDDLLNEVETLILNISDYNSDDKTIGVVKNEKKNAKPNR